MTAKLLGTSRFLVGLALASFAGLFFFDALPQDPAYHNFADQRPLLGIPHFWNVISNLPFVIFGLNGMAVIRRSEDLPQRTAWWVFALGVVLVGCGSAYYHWSPDSATLIWDRLPMTVGFMAAITAIGAETVWKPLERFLIPLLALGAASVIWWWARDDLRFYAWVQFFPLVALLIILLLPATTPAAPRRIWWALGWYVGAKVCEHWDVVICDALGGTLSGHTIKHVLAALGCRELLVRLRLLKQT